VHEENAYVDFKREYLIPYQLSKQGPKMAKADVNGDGLEDIYIGGAAEQPGAVFLQLENGKFTKSSTQPWLQDAIYEDIGCVFFDADNDRDPDLYVVSGGSEWSGAVPGLQDRLYLNDGKGNFQKSEAIIPAETYSGSCVAAADFDKDGDVDLFVGARVTPGKYPFSEGNMILRNDLDKKTGKLQFTDITATISREFSAMGMVTDAVWTDINRDAWPDLVVVGDWMPVTIFQNDGGKQLTNISKTVIPEFSDGWWCKVVPADLDKDGDIDFILGNMGNNTQFKVSDKQPLVTYGGDFNGDGTIDPLMTWFVQGKSYPFHTRDEVVEQMPQLNKKFLMYEDYAKSSISELVGGDKLDNAKRFHIYNTSTSLLINNNGNFELKSLPVAAQVSMMNSIVYGDYDGDGNEDILMAGNFYPFRVQLGRCDAGIGTFLKGDGKGNFVIVPQEQTGFYVPGDTRDMIPLQSKSGGSMLVISKNNSSVQVLKVGR
jgi:hypothetical protein